MRWSGVGIDEWWRNEQFWVIGGVSAHLFAVFQGLLKVLVIARVIFMYYFGIFQKKLDTTSETN